MAELWRLWSSKDDGGGSFASAYSNSCFGNAFLMHFMFPFSSSIFDRVIAIFVQLRLWKIPIPSEKWGF